MAAPYTSTLLFLAFLVHLASSSFTIGAQPREALIRLNRVADLDELVLPESLDRPARRNAVHLFLSAFAAREQAGVRAVLARHGVAHESFWIVNAVHAHNLTAAAADELRALRLDDGGGGNGDGGRVLCDIEAVGGVHRIKPVPKHVARKMQGLGDVDDAFPIVGSGGVQANIKKVKADQCWSTENATGAGVTVATLDGGVNYLHPALVGSYRGTRDGGKSFVHDYNWADFAYQNSEPDDTGGEGHGSNVAGILSGSEASGVGVAPGAKWISAKIFNFAGYSAASWTISGLQWVLCPTPVNKKAPADCSRGADVVSCSWGQDTATDASLEQSVKAWLKAGTVPVFAVGNAGPACKTSVAPADYRGVIGVGGTMNDDSLLAFSSRGPTPNATTGATGLNPLAPAIVAPGYDILGPAKQGDGYNGLSGTSQACPHVAGAAALVLGANPKLTPAQVADALFRGAVTSDLSDPGQGDSCGGKKWNSYPNFAYGYGALDCLAAVQAAKKML